MMLIGTEDLNVGVDVKLQYCGNLEIENISIRDKEEIILQEYEEQILCKMKIDIENPLNKAEAILNPAP